MDRVSSMGHHGNRPRHVTSRPAHNKGAYHGHSNHKKKIDVPMHTSSRIHAKTIEDGKVVFSSP